MWYQKAANQEHANAQWNLGAIYENGQGVPRSFVLVSNGGSAKNTRGLTGVWPSSRPFNRPREWNQSSAPIAGP